MRLFADTSITTTAVRALRARGDDVMYSGERANDPGDAALLAEALADRRVFITEDHDIGTLVYSDGCEHAGVILIEDLGDPSAKAAPLTSVLEEHATQTRWRRLPPRRRERAREAWGKLAPCACSTARPSGCAAFALVTCAR